jgi:hypothetical protein
MADPTLAAPASPPIRDTSSAALLTTAEPQPQSDDVDSSGDGGSRVKTAAVVAGAAAVANKMRQQAPKLLHQLRERRLAGRHVIVTEVDGRFLAIGPYKNEDQARKDSFKVGGTPHVAELVPDDSFFAPPDRQ